MRGCERCCVFFLYECYIKSFAFVFFFKREEKCEQWRIKWCTISFVYFLTRSIYHTRLRVCLMLLFCLISFRYWRYSINNKNDVTFLYKTVKLNLCKRVGGKQNNARLEVNKNKRFVTVTKTNKMHSAPSVCECDRWISTTTAMEKNILFFAIIHTGEKGWVALMGFRFHGPFIG